MVAGPGQGSAYTPPPFSLANWAGPAYTPLPSTGVTVVTVVTVASNELAVETPSGAWQMVEHRWRRVTNISFSVLSGPFLSFFTPSIGSWRPDGPCRIDFSVSGPPPGWFQGLGPLSRKQKHALFSAVTWLSPRAGGERRREYTLP